MLSKLGIRCIADGDCEPVDREQRPQRRGLDGCLDDLSPCATRDDRTCLSKVSEDHDNLTTKWKVVPHYPAVDVFDTRENSAVGHGPLIPHCHCSLSKQVRPRRVKRNSSFEELVVLVYRQLLNGQYMQMTGMMRVE